MKLIIALGNPGEKYKKTKHNAGFLFIDYYVFVHQNLNEQYTYSDKFDAELLAFFHNQEKVIVAKPQTFMNNSGSSVRKIADYYNASIDDIIIVYDDKDLDFGVIRESGTSSGGHNGIKSIIRELGSTDFNRIRIGIKTEKINVMDTSDFVLSRFSKDELSEMSTNVFPLVAKKIDTLLDHANKNI